MAEYRKQTLEEVDQIQTLEQQQQQNQQNHVVPLRPATPKASPTQATAPPPCDLDAPFAAASATTHKPGSPRTPKKKDDSAGVRRPMAPELLLPPGPRTTDPSAGGQMPGEDSWDWYERSILGLPPVPLPSHSATAHPALREGVQD
ncbi:hypothetical protein PSPO01_15867 [Paraphaeosphaeria sporulosa]